MIFFFFFCPVMHIHPFTPSIHLQLNVHHLSRLGPYCTGKKEMKHNSNADKYSASSHLKYTRTATAMHKKTKNNNNKINSDIWFIRYISTLPIRRVKDTNQTMLSLVIVYAVCALDC